MGCSLLFVLGLAGCGTSPEFVEEVAEPDAEDYAPRRELRSLLGVWKGQGQQSDGPSWNMELSITSHRPGRCATIRYPSSGCSGYWVCTSPFDGVQLDAVEHITEGQGNCIDGVAVQVVANEGGRTISFYAVTGDIQAEGRLARQ